MQCLLDKDINKCPYFNTKTLECNNPNKCSFQEVKSQESKNQYVRKERWYEKYYK